MAGMQNVKRCYIALELDMGEIVTFPVQTITLEGTHFHGIWKAENTTDLTISLPQIKRLTYNDLKRDDIICYPEYPYKPMQVDGFKIDINSVLLKPVHGGSGGGWMPEKDFNDTGYVRYEDVVHPLLQDFYGVEEKTEPPCMGSYGYLHCSDACGKREECKEKSKKKGKSIMGLDISFDLLRQFCKHFSSKGEEQDALIVFCGHPDNSDDTEGNCAIDLCPILPKAKDRPPSKFCPICKRPMEAEEKNWYCPNCGNTPLFEEGEP